MVHKAVNILKSCQTFQTLQSEAKSVSQSSLNHFKKPQRQKRGGNEHDDFQPDVIIAVSGEGRLIICRINASISDANLLSFP